MKKRTKLDATDVKEKQKEQPKPTGEKVYSDNLAKDFSSFDVLWFDLSTKVRAMMDELTQPIYHMAYEQEGKLK